MSDSLRIAAEAPEDFVPTRPEGLTEVEAAKRPRNKTSEKPDKPLGQIVLSNLLTLFNLLNFGLAACLMLVGSWRNMLFLGVVFSNLAIGTIQEIRARRTIRRLRLLQASRARVLREGKERAVPPEELALGDLVILRAGDEVPADAVIAGGTGAANEALLTGESDPVPKKPGDWLMSGSYIAEGRFTAQLARVGDDSYAARLTRAAREIRRPKSALMTDLGKLVKWLSIFLVPAGALLFLKQTLILDAPLQQAVPSAVAAMIGMIPEGLMLLTSTAMAVGVVRLGRKNTLVQELYGIETLARTDVLCLDKTGTLTTGAMRVERLVPAEADGAAFRAALSRFLGAFEIAGGTLTALAAAAAPGREKPVAVLPFSSERKCSAASFADGTTYALGALSFLTARKGNEALFDEAERAASEGLRVLALVECEGALEENRLPPVRRTLGLALLSDELRGNAAETLRYFAGQGVELKIISGDDPRTAAMTGRRAGLPHAGRWVDASALSDEELENACEAYAVFGRVTPDRKRRLVEALKRRGHSVAMTGDGVNDIPAVKAADCSIALAGGCDAIRHAAQLTLLDADFAHLPTVVDEGRRVIGNVTRAASLFLVKTLYSLALTLLTLFLPAPYPFQPIQLTLVSALTIGAPSFLLAFENNRERVSGAFLRQVALRAVPGAAAVTVCAAASMLTAFLGWPREVCATLATVSAGCVGLMMLSTVCRPFTRLRAAVLASMSAAFALCVLLFGRAFYLAALSPVQLLALAALIALGMGTMAGLRWLEKKKSIKNCPERYS